MNKNSNKLVLYMFVLVLFIGATCLLRTMACVGALDENLLYFEKDSLILPADIITAVGVVLLFTLSLSMKKDDVRLSFSSPTAYVPTGIIAVALILFMLKMIDVYIDLSGMIAHQAQIPISAWLALACAVITPLSIIHFFLSAFLTERKTGVRAYFALATILLAAIYASFLYFSTGMPLNAPNKIVEQMAYLFAAIFLLYEARISLGRELLRMYTAFGLVAALITAYASIPALLTYFVSGNLITYSLESAVLLLALFIFIFTRLSLVMSAAHNGESAEMTALREYAERRAAELASVTVEDGTQISIDELIELTPMPTFIESEESTVSDESVIPAIDEMESEPEMSGIPEGVIEEIAVPTEEPENADKEVTEE